MKSFRVCLIATALAAFFSLQAPTAATGLADPFGGAWTANDPADGSTLRLEIGAPSAAGARHVTLLDQFASACNAPATAIGSGTASDTTLSATLDVRCGGTPVAAEVPFTFVLVGDTLVGDDIVFTRVGRGGA
jgi:hypothetical protein